MAAMATERTIDSAGIIRVYTVDGRPYEKDQRASEATRLALETNLSLNTNKMNFGEFIAFVRAETGANIMVNWQALELVGIDQDSLFTLQLKQVPPRSLIRVVLEKISADAFDDDKAGLAIRDGVAIVSTLRELRKAVETRIYDVAWFLDPRLNLNTQLYDRDDPKRHGWLHGRVEKSGKNIHVNADDLAEWWFYCKYCDATTGKDGSVSVPSRQELVDQLIELITTTVGDPDEWLDEESTIDDMAERLTVTTTSNNHNAILQLLKMHRRLQVEAFEQQAKTIAVTLLLRDAEKHRLDRDYREALELIDQALKVDPDHAETRVLRRVVVQSMSD